MDGTDTSAIWEFTGVLAEQHGAYLLWHSENAVQTPISIARSDYRLVAIVRKASASA
jgi:hypothetical protein